MAHTENLAVHAPEGPTELTATVPKAGGTPPPQGRRLPKEELIQPRFVGRGPAPHVGEPPHPRPEPEAEDGA